MIPTATPQIKLATMFISSFFFYFFTHFKNYFKIAAPMKPMITPTANAVVIFISSFLFFYLLFLNYKAIPIAIPATTPQINPITIVSFLLSSYFLFSVITC